MLKKIAALAVAFCAAGAAQAADLGPIYVYYPGYCNVKSVYMTPGGDLYGQELGCSGILGAPMVGFVNTNGSFVFSTRDGSARACMHNYLPNGTVSAGCSSGLGVEYPVPIPYAVSVTPPRMATGKTIGELPRLPF